MSEEEKKAINVFKSLLDDFKGLSKLSLWYEIDSEKQNELYNKLYPLLNLIEKQQKEIEKLNFENHMVKKWNEQLDKNCINKDKIREKIEELKKQDELSELSHNYLIIGVLQELLEEKYK